MIPRCLPLRMLLLLAVLTGCSREETLLLVVPRHAVDQEIAEDFAELFSEPGEVQIELVPNPDPDSPGFEMLKTGAADLALVANTESYDPRLTTVVPLYPTVLHIAHRADQPVESVERVVIERSVFAGPPGSPSRDLLETAVAHDGITPDQIRYVETGTTCADVMVVYAPVLPDIPDRIGRCGEYRLFSLGAPEDIGSGSALDSVELLNPNLKPFVIPRDTYGRLTPEPVVTLAVDKLLVARSDLPEAVIYDLLGEILRLKPALSASYPGLYHQLRDDFDISSTAFALHEGALAYLQRDEPDVYERYSGVAEVLVTLFIGLISGIYAIYRIFTIRQKNRIDAFCREALDIRDRAVAEGGERGRAEAVTALRALEDRAYQMLIQEKLAADESFRIFITLCHDVRAELAG